MDDALLHDRPHPIVTLGDGDLARVRAFYEALGFRDVTPQGWVATGAVTLQWQGCPLTFVPAGSPMAPVATPTERFTLFLQVRDVAGAARAFGERGRVDVPVRESPWGPWAELLDPAGTRLVLISAD